MAKKAKRRLVELGVNAASPYLPDIFEGPLRRLLGMSDLAVKPKAALAAKPKAALAAKPKASLAAKPKASLAVKPKQLALPAPPKQLALPAPGPGLPPLASKPRGGQFWTDRMFGDLGGSGGTNMSPEDAVRLTRQNDPALSMLRADDFDPGTGHGAQLGDWLERTLTKYYKTDFGAPDDPLRSLAERGLHYDPEMTPERWKETVNAYLAEDTIGSVLLPPSRAGALPGAGNDLRAEAMISMPWLAKQPVTDNIYGIHMGGLDLAHFTDEMRNAMAPVASGLPMDLAVRPESLGRMTFPQAVEQVGKINQYRAKEMERAGLSNLNSPAVQTFKEYPENNPMGLRWAELKAPDDIPEGYSVRLGNDAPREGYFGAYGPDGQPIAWGPTEDEARRMARRVPLQQALKYEGDTMGHCVGGYCPDVMEGRSRIFSLRDAKGEPHVTIETSPKSMVFSDLRAAVGDDNADRLLHEAEVEFGQSDRMDTTPLAIALERAGVQRRQDIVQIKGKQNRAPKDDYLPFVQDFVKSQPWSNVGDIRNTGLVKLPDGRYITQQQYDSVVGDERLDDMYQSYDFNARQFPRDPTGMAPEDWEQFKRHFEGFAIGGRVSADRCFTRSPLSVR